MSEACCGDKGRQDLYKTRASPWKDVYRQKCMERLREKRAKQHAQRRNLETAESIEPKTDREENMEILGVMEDEWDVMRLAGWGKEFQYKNMTFTASRMVDEIMVFFEDIKKEMEEEEKRLVEQCSQVLCEDYMRQEEEEICESMKALTTYQVICPICEKYNLVEHKFLILCRCGLNINTEQDCINLKHIHNNLERATQEHSRQCEEKPAFSFTDKYGISNLIMTCAKCDFMYIIV